MVGPIGVKQKGSALVRYWIQYVTLTIDLTYDLDFVCFKVQFRNALSPELLVLLMWKEKEVS